MKHLKYLYSLLACVFLLSCKKEVLDRPPLDKIIDSDNGFWRNEDDVRLYTNAFYPNYFTGFNTGFTVDYTPVRGYTFNDDLTGKNVQSNFESSVPTSRGSTSGRRRSRPVTTAPRAACPTRPGSRPGPN